MKVLAPAKINLFLEVTGMRPDRYHELETLFQTISLYDRLEMTRAPKGAPRIRFEVRGDAALRRLCPGDASNIVWKAADLFLKKFKIDVPIRIALEKNIPIQAGLGGGSSDAAAALNGLARLFGLRKRKGFERDIRAIAKACGADVPFLLRGGCALAAGIGDRVRPLPRTPRFWAVVVKPPVGCPTKDVYGWLDAARGWDRPGRREKRRAVDSGLTRRPKIHTITRLIRENKPAGEWGKHLYNAFEAVVFQKHPRLEEIKRFLLMEGAQAASLSGSGSALYGLVSSKNAGERIRRALKLSSGKAWVVRSV